MVAPLVEAMFTYAISDHDDEDGPLTLLFEDRTGNRGLNTPQTMSKIVAHPLIRKLFAGGGFLLQPSDDLHQLALTTDMQTLGILAIDTAKEGDRIVHFNAQGTIRNINLHEEYYACTIPHKLIVGCTGCYNAAELPSRMCTVRREVEKQDTCKTVFSPADVKELLKSRKDSIAGFTFVSPQLTKEGTSEGHFGKTFRPIHEHDFGMVEEHTATRIQALRERGRFNRFKKEVCSTCLVFNASKRSKYSYDPSCTGDRYCRGAYKYDTDADVAKTILEQQQLNYTDAQLVYLLHNSGELNKKHQRRRYWATFDDTWSKGLQFGLRRVTTGEFEPLDMPFKEVKKFLEEYTLAKPVNTHPRTLPDVSKALLLELSKVHTSPQNRRGWHTAPYGVLGIRYHHYDHSLELHFKYNSWGGWSRASRGWVVPWTISAKTFADIYAEQTHFNLIQKTLHPLSYLEYRRR